MANMHAVEINGVMYNLGTSDGLAFVGTRAEYEVAKLIPVDTEGHIPSGALVIITDENSYVKGEEQS